jgi:hypothetical protein
MWKSFVVVGVTAAAAATTAAAKRMFKHSINFIEFLFSVAPENY